MFTKTRHICLILRISADRSCHVRFHFPFSIYLVAETKGGTEEIAGSMPSQL